MNIDQIIKCLCDRPLVELLEVQGEVLRECDRRLKNSADPTPVDPLQLEMLNYHIAQQIWIQYAVWNKFGNEEQVFKSAEELNLRVSPLLTSPRVVKYMASVNDQVAAAQFDQGSACGGASVNVSSLGRSTSSTCHSGQVSASTVSSKPLVRKFNLPNTAKKASKKPSTKPTTAQTSQHANVSDEEGQSDSVDRWANGSDADKLARGDGTAAAPNKEVESHSGAEDEHHDSTRSDKGDNKGDDQGEEEASYSSRLRVRPVKKVKCKLSTPPSVSQKPAEPRTTLTWTEYMLHRLEEGVRLYKGESWAKVARHVGFRVTPAQCAATWAARTEFQPPASPLKVAKKTRWTNAELASEFVVPAQWGEEVQGSVPERVDWFRVAQALDRPPRACKKKHLAMEKTAAQKKAGEETVNKVMRMAAVKEEENSGGDMREGEGVGGGEDVVMGGEEDESMDNHDGVEVVGEGEGEDEGEGDDQMTEELNEEAESAVVDLTAETA